MSAFYYTHLTSWYSLPEETKAIQGKTASFEQKDFCEMYDRALRQTTTMEKADTLPESCYRNEFRHEKLILVALKQKIQ